MQVPWQTMVGTHESSFVTSDTMATRVATSEAAAAVAAAAKAQEFAHRVVEFAEYDACIKFFEEKPIDFDKPNATGSTILMSVVTRARVDLIGYVMDRTNNVESVTIPNGTTVLHLAAMATNPQVIKELTGTDERKAKLKPIANSCNRNDDTPLMMASVVKNAIAAKLLVEYLDAFPNPKNASGMTALMCASRLQDEREGPSVAAESAAIVSLLLAYGADVNATDSAGRQSALHFALLTRNVMVIEQLLTISDINLSSRNKAGHTPLELAKKLKLDDLINAAVESQWQVVEDEARVLSEQVAEELAHATQPVSRGSTSPQKKTKKKKKSATTAAKKEELIVAEQSTSEADTVTRVDEEEEIVATPSVDTAVVKMEGELLADADDDWVTASKKKPKRQESISSEPQATSKQPKPHTSQKSNHSKPKPTSDIAAKHKSKGESAANTKTSTVAKPKSESTPIKQTPPQPKAATPAEPQPKPVSQSVPQPKPAPWTTHSAPVQPRTTASPPLPVASTPPPPVPFTAATVRASSPQRSPFSYDELNAIFQRMFPIAEEMDIPVESFVAGASTHDTNDLLGSLSISQVEILQEAHLQAYHYLNERKIELTRVLEAQRLESQMELRRRFYHLP